ncbi:hypothetical protein [Cupriavidus sp. EM10]|uniref:hypothetical protein n=1 Tax=Cupriavidus sp. EM10 TaxID=2839983 RepID=UPI001C007E70|nr:hypothetical protein [Cupriavidus sp. EM10]QWE96324.1 hypothetical protein KLP38_24280 [Cupriavidus sp. EM10]
MRDLGKNGQRVGVRFEQLDGDRAVRGGDVRKQSPARKRLPTTRQGMPSGVS